MPEPTDSHEELMRTARAYLGRLSDEPPPHELGAHAVTLALTRRRRFSLLAVLGGSAVVIASATAAVLALAFHAHSGPGVTGTAVAPSLSSTPTAAPQPPHLSLSGTLGGEVTGARTKCAPGHRNVEGGFDSSVIVVDGVVGGHNVQIQIYDPSQFGTVNDLHVLVIEALANTPQNAPFSGWGIQSPAGISGFDVSRGAALDVTLQPAPFESSSRATTPAASIALHGVITC